MRPFKWTAGDIFLPEIDAEHRAIGQSASELQEAIQGSAPVGRILERLRALHLAMEDHFRHEERLLKAASYPSLAWHQQQHDTARARLKQFARRIEAGDRNASPLLLEFLDGWLRDHVSVADRMAGSYLRNYERSRGRRPKAS
jgi:hemerythrin